MISRETLEQLYPFMGISKISEKTGESYDNIRCAMMVYGITPNRKKIRSKQINPIIKETHVRSVDIWNPYPSEFNEKLKDQIRDAHHNKCYICGISGSVEHSLDVHHVDSNPKNNDCSNLVPVCRSCHSKITMFNRYKLF